MPNKNKRSYRDDIIRGLAVVTAALILFLGPRFVENDDTRDIDATISYVKSAKLSKQFTAQIIAQFESDKKFAQENGDKIAALGLRLTMVQWFALIIVVVGFAGPFLLKWRYNSQARREGA